VRSFGASLGTVPDYVGPPDGQKGMLLAGVRTGGAADLAGMKRGDILVQVGSHPIGGVEDLMYVLNESKPGQTVTVIVLRDGKQVKLEATFQEAKRAR
jgi:S1-C subfamily serine protease